MNLSFEEKKQKIEEFWNKTLQECIVKNTITPNLLKVLGELKNPSLQKDFLVIWIDLCTQCLQNEMTPKFIKHKIFNALIKETFWFKPDTVQYQCVQEIFKSFQILISINKNYLFVILKQMIENFKQLSATSQVKHLQNLKFDFKDQKDVTVEILHDLFEDRIKMLNQKLYFKKRSEQYNVFFELFKLHPKISQDIINDFQIVYAWKEKEQITARFYVQNDVNSNNYTQVDFDQMFEYFIQKKIEKQDQLQQFFEQFTKILKFYKKLIKFASINNADQFQQDFKFVIEELNINRFIAGNQYMFIGLLILLQDLKELKFYGYEKLMKFMIELDIECKISQNNIEMNQDYQFYLQCMFIVINNNFSKKQKKINSPILRFLNKKIKKSLKKRPLVEGRENQTEYINFFMEYLVKKIIPLESPLYVQLISFYVIKLSENQKIKNIKLNRYFLQTLYKYLFSTNTHLQIKNKILVYIYSFIKVNELDEQLLHESVINLFRFFYKITKNILYKIKKDFSKMIKQGTLQKIEGRAKKHYLSYFNKGIFYNLLFYLEKILNQNFQEFSTNKTIDLVNEFEKYFNKFWIYLKILVENDNRALNFFTDLNKIIKNPYLNDLIHSKFNSQLDLAANINQSQNDFNNMSNTSFSNFSKISFSSYKTINSQLNKGKNFQLNVENLPFQPKKIRIFKNYFLVQNKILERKISIQETDNSLMQTPQKRKISNDEMLSAIEFLERQNQIH